MKNSNQSILIEILPIGIYVFNLPEIADEKELDEFFIRISNNVKHFRLKNNLSQLETALSIGQKSSGFYANAENYSHGKHFNLTHLYKLSKLFEVKIEDFFK